MPEWIELPGATVKRSIDGNGALIVSATEGLLTSNAAGDSVRLASGIQVCTHVVKLERAAADYLRAIWTFPQPFLTRIRLQMTVAAVSSGTLIPYLGLHRVVPLDATQTDLRVYRINGAPAFVTGDTVDVAVLAIGLWK